MFEEFVLPGTWRITVGSLAFAIVMSILVFVTIRRALIRVYMDWRAKHLPLIKVFSNRICIHTPIFATASTISTPLVVVAAASTTSSSSTVATESATATRTTHSITAHAYVLVLILFGFLALLAQSIIVLYKVYKLSYLMPNINTLILAAFVSEGVVLQGA